MPAFTVAAPADHAKKIEVHAQGCKHIPMGEAGPKRIYSKWEWKTTLEGVSPADVIRDFAAANDGFEVEDFKTSPCAKESK